MLGRASARDSPHARSARQSEIGDDAVDVRGEPGPPIGMYRTYVRKGQHRRARASGHD